MKPKYFLPQYHLEKKEAFGMLRTPTFLCEASMRAGMVAFNILKFEEWFEAEYGKVPDGTSLS